MINNIQPHNIKRKAIYVYVSTQHSCSTKQINIGNFTFGDEVTSRFGYNRFTQHFLTPLTSARMPKCLPLEADQTHLHFGR